MAFRTGVSDFQFFLSAVLGLLLGEDLPVGSGRVSIGLISVVDVFWRSRKSEIKVIAIAAASTPIKTGRFIDAIYA